MDIEPIDPLGEAERGVKIASISCNLVGRGRGQNVGSAGVTAVSEHGRLRFDFTEGHGVGQSVNDFSRCHAFVDQKHAVADFVGVWVPHQPGPTEGAVAGWIVANCTGRILARILFAWAEKAWNLGFGDRCLNRPVDAVIDLVRKIRLLHVR